MILARAGRQRIAGRTPPCRWRSRSPACAPPPRAPLAPLRTRRWPRRPACRDRGSDFSLATVAGGARQLVLDPLIGGLARIGSDEGAAVDQHAGHGDDADALAGELNGSIERPRPPSCPSLAGHSPTNRLASGRGRRSAESAGRSGSSGRGMRRDAQSPGKRVVDDRRLDRMSPQAARRSTAT